MNPRSRKLIVSGVLVALLLVSLLGALFPSLAQADVTADSRTPAITGIAADRARGVWWAAGSSGSTVTAIDRTGRTVGTVSFAAKPVSVQGLAVRNGTLFVGDVGDPQQSRTAIDVYGLGNLRLALTGGGEATFKKYRLVYPDGAHDAAAMTLSPNGRIYVITRGQKPGIYRTIPNVQPGEAIKLTRMTDAPARVNDAAYTADGSKLVLRTENGLTVLEGNEFQVVGTAALSAEAHGEGLATALRGTGLVVASATKPAKLIDVDLPTSVVKLPSVPAPSSAAPGTATAASSPRAAASAAPANESTAAPRTGTFAALGAAAIISLLAGVVVAVRR